MTASTGKQRVVVALLVGVAVLGAAGFATLAAFGWHKYSELKDRGQVPSKIVALAGCDSTYFYDPTPPDAGVAMPRHYPWVVCVRRAGTPPTCDEVARRYVASQGALPTDLHVTVRRSIKDQKFECNAMFRGDGTLK